MSRPEVLSPEQIDVILAGHGVRPLDESDDAWITEVRDEPGFYPDEAWLSGQNQAMAAGSRPVGSVYRGPNPTPQDLATLDTVKARDVFYGNLGWLDEAHACHLSFHALRSFTRNKLPYPVRAAENLRVLGHYALEDMVSLLSSQHGMRLTMVRTPPLQEKLDYLFDHSDKGSLVLRQRPIWLMKLTGPEIVDRAEQLQPEEQLLSRDRQDDSADAAHTTHWQQIVDNMEVSRQATLRNITEHMETDLTDVMMACPQIAGCSAEVLTAIAEAAREKYDAGDEVLSLRAMIFMVRDLA